MSDSPIQLLIDLLETGNLRLIMITFTIGLVAAFVMQFFKRTFGSPSKLFYSESFAGDDNDFAKRLKDLEKETKKIQSELTDKLFKNTREKIDSEVNSYLDSNLDDLTERKLDDNGVLEKRLVKSFESKILNQLESYLGSIDIKDIAALKNKAEIDSRKKSADEHLIQTLEQERRSAGLLKSVMINLFVMVNLGLFLLYLLTGSELNQYAAISLSGLYISLAAFIIYIFRASNARTSVLLAIKEDMGKQLTAYEYASNAKENNSLSGNDIEYLRMLLSNHAEREKGTSHPYEVILKGISGSNIQFKGGKMSMGKSESNSNK
jgi:ABC-type multidrug transport system fused ATPase/permease subunit